MLSEMTLFNMEWITADALAKSVKIGDLIEFQRAMPYRHWAVCVEANGDSSIRSTADVKVVHLEPRLFGVSGFGAYILAHHGRVRIQQLKDVHMGRACRINNVMDQRYAPLGNSQIVQLALKREGQHIYSRVYCNSEHFVNLCRYGRHETLEESIPPLALCLIALLVVCIIPSAITVGALTGFVVFLILWVISQKARTNRTADSVMDPKIPTANRTIE